MTGARLLCCLAWAAAGACTSSHERERYDFERMRVQQRAEVYETSMRPAPNGTISRESASDTIVPIAMTAALFARGRRQFTIYCAVCHGDGGFGGSIVAENMGAPRPPSLRGAALRAQPLSYVYDVATRGKGRMPPYAPQLTAADRWAIAAYVRQLQTTGVTTLEQRDDSLRAIRIHSIDSLVATERRK
jgi:mono/diheme cytochrome c family protein